MTVTLCWQRVQRCMQCAVVGLALIVLNHGAEGTELDSSSVPATPLVACDPYFSIWSTGKRLTDADTTHWTGKPHRLTSLAAVDGKCYRLMGAEPKDVPALEQTGSRITPTQTSYVFRGGGVELTIKFTTPALPSDIDLLSRPITYVSFSTSSTDGKPHSVQIYFEASAELTVNTPDQAVAGSTEHPQGLRALKLGSEEQLVLEKSGDDLRIDWGYFYLAASEGSALFSISSPQALRDEFLNGQKLPASESGKAAQAGDLSAAVVLPCDASASEPGKNWLIVAYDDLESIEFMGARLKPYWRRDGLDAEGLLVESAKKREETLANCDEFDRDLTAELTSSGGADYAAIATLAYRQCFAAGKFVADANGQPIQFCKENHSNGCIGTSDVFYPMAPQFLLFGPSLAKSFVVPFMEYAASERWKFPFAPHDLGTYPQANGQVYGGGEKTEENQMPVEESGNLLILMGAIAKMEGNADFASRYWPQLEQWAQYLKDKGFDPANQLCTDDFAGHLAHNVNLSAKAICGLAAFAQLCELRGDAAQAQEYRQTAEEFAARWVKEADDGDHFRLAFDKPGTWSQKYNLVWDRILGLDLFPSEVLRKEMAHYRKVQNRFGLPLDSRKTYTKLDWTLWTATLTGEQDDFEAIVRPVREFLREAPDRSPMTDWYETKSGKKVGFTARPVVGGVLLKLLYDESLWKKWASRDKTKGGNYAPMPIPPRVTVVLPAADVEPATWRYTTEQPADDWSKIDFDDADWKAGPSGFGKAGTMGARIGTTWDTPSIWIRRTFDFPKQTSGVLWLNVHHDDNAEIYINGQLARRLTGYCRNYGRFSLPPEIVATLKSTGNVMAIHCRQIGGGQYIDAGIVSTESSGK